MKHFGDITKLSGYDLPPVDIIVGGSPCQDLSVAGGRSGLAGERSGLFMDQIRIVKEMRKNNEHTKRADDDIRPRYMLWENVPGAFSSNKGADFQTVLSEIVRIADPSAPDVPMPQTGRWPKAGMLYDEMGSWSIAWRVHDAQFWGVPQRRRRISLIADFGGLSAPEILFERQGMRRDPETSREAREEDPGDAGESTCSSGIAVCLNDQGGQRMELSAGVCGTLCAQDHGHTPLVFENHPQDSRYGGPLDASPTVVSRYGTGGNNSPIVVETEHYCASKNSFFTEATEELASMLVATDYKDPPIINDTDGTDYIVRRLTPTECERLQGFPDGWTDIGEWIDSNGRTRQTTDSARYKALGNSIALPFWQYLARRIVAQYEHDVTMASLFDGIGGFPLVFERSGARAVWASEIEDFPIAVTKKHFPEEAAQ